MALRTCPVDLYENLMRGYTLTLALEKLSIGKEVEMIVMVMMMDGRWW